MIKATVGSSSIRFARGTSSGEANVQYEPGKPIATYYVTTLGGIEFMAVAPGRFTVVDTTEGTAIGRAIEGCGTDDVTFLAGLIQPLPSGSLSLTARGDDGRSTITITMPVVPDAGASGVLTG